MPGLIARPARGALAGATAASLWALQQGLDTRVFGIPYDDVELLGRLVVRTGPDHYAVGLAWHCLNGAAFGAVYAKLAPSLPGPRWMRGLAAGLAEHLVTWPATALVGRLHPRADAFPPLFGSRRALAQATWRHALFGVSLGVLEARLNPGGPAEPPPPVPADAAESTHGPNGHGPAERVDVTVRA